MRATIMALVFLLIGTAVGGVLAIGFGAGMGAASGVVMGAQAGVCLAAETAHDQGTLDDTALEGLIATAIDKIRTKSGAMPVGSGIDWVEDRAGCIKLLEQFVKGTEQQGA